MEKWEYRIITLKKGLYLDTDDLNALGGEGWELCEGDDSGKNFIFKRKITKI